jgi:hypothetical protein
MPAQAGATTLPVREWGEPVALNSASHINMLSQDIAYTEPRELLLAFPRFGGGGDGPDGLVVATKQTGEESFDEALVDTQVAEVAVAGSGAGEAALAWYRYDDNPAHKVSIRDADGNFSTPVVFHGPPAGNWSSKPRVAMNAAGDAVVVFSQGQPGGGDRLYLTFRRAGGSFGPAVEVNPGAPTASVQLARDVAIAPSGEAVIAWLENGAGRIATRPRSGPIGPAQAIGGTCPTEEGCYLLPQVEIDGFGNAAALTRTGDEGDFHIGQLQLAFRPAGEPFRDPEEIGIGTSDVDPAYMRVSGLGELVIAAQDIRDNPSGGASLNGIRALFGLTALGVRGPVGLVHDWDESYPSLGMNARGDTVLVTMGSGEDDEGRWSYHITAVRKIAAASFVPVNTFAAGPIPVYPEGQTTNGRSGYIPDRAVVDPYGNAAVLWRDSDPLPQIHNVSEDGPLIDVEPPEIDLSDVIPPLFGALPEVEVPPVDMPAVPPVELPPLPLPPLVPAGGPELPPADAQPPVLRVRPTGAVDGPRTWLALGCSEACNLRLRSYLKVPGAKRSLRLPELALRLKRAGSKRIALPLSRKIRKRISRASRGPKLVLQAVGTDAAGNVGRAKASVRLR